MRKNGDVDLIMAFSQRNPFPENFVLSINFFAQANKSSAKSKFPVTWANMMKRMIDI